jgi:response regulator RpfG family c-di-GMP phosphodiesterase
VTSWALHLAVEAEAQDFAVADALDAMTSHRPYRRAMSWESARSSSWREA